MSREGGVISSMEIRLARLGDVDALLELQAACFPPALWDARADVERTLARSVYVVAEDGDRIVGSAIGLRRASDYHVYAVEVLLAWRRRGLGAELLRAVLSCAPAAVPITASAASEAGKRLLRRFPAIELVPVDLDAAR